MPCACQNKRQAFEVVPNVGTATRAAFTAANQATAEAVADRYPTSIVRDKKTQEAVYFAWPKGAYEVVLLNGDGPAVVSRTVIRTDADKAPLKAAADDRAGEGAVVRSTDNGTVVYPLTAALTASGSTIKAAGSPAAVTP